MLCYKLKKRGITGILNLAAALRAQDSNRDSTITLTSLLRVSSNLGLDLSDIDAKLLFQFLRVPGREELMDFSQLLKDLTIGLDQHRRALIRNTFDRLNYSEKPTFDLRILKELFNVRNHYEVKNGRRTSEEVLQDFFKAIELFVEYNCSPEVGSEQFLEFWTLISPVVETSGEFESLLKNCFRFNELPRQNKLAPPGSRGGPTQSAIYDQERYHPADSIKYTVCPGSDRNVSDRFIFNIFEHLRKQLVKKGGPKGIMMLFRSFKCNDFDADGRLSCKEFVKSLNEVRVELLEKETLNVFKVFDPKNSGFISISEFMSAFIPELNPRRRAVVEELIEGLGGGSGKITYSRIKKIFYARGHPDFKSGKKADYEITDEFFLVLNTFLGLTGGINDYLETDLLLQFLEILSYAFDNDDYFEMILRGVFRMNRLGFDTSEYTAGLSTQWDNESQFSEYKKGESDFRPLSQKGRRHYEPKSTHINQDRLPEPHGAHVITPSPDPSPPRGDFGKRDQPGVVNDDNHNPPIISQPREQPAPIVQERAQIVQEPPVRREPAPVVNRAPTFTSVIQKIKQQ